MELESGRKKCLKVVEIKEFLVRRGFFVIRLYCKMGGYSQNGKDKGKAGKPRQVMQVWGPYIRHLQDET